MGCTLQTRFRVSGGWVVRERRIFRDDTLASESVLGERVDLPDLPT